MSNTWLTKVKDMEVAEKIMQEYAVSQNSPSLGLFELVVSTEAKRMDFRLSAWVFTLAHYFQSRYGVAQGEFVTRKIISSCLIHGQTVH